MDCCDYLGPKLIDELALRLHIEVLLDFGIERELNVFLLCIVQQYFMDIKLADLTHELSHKCVNLLI